MANVKSILYQLYLPISIIWDIRSDYKLNKLRWNNESPCYLSNRDKILTAKKSSIFSFCFLLRNCAKKINFR